VGEVGRKRRSEKGSEKSVEKSVRGRREVQLIEILLSSIRISL